jgi:hypothetical protein
MVNLLPALLPASVIILGVFSGKSREKRNLEIFLYQGVLGIKGKWR